jgi:hypothetical protein
MRALQVEQINSSAGSAQTRQIRVSASAKDSAPFASAPLGFSWLSLRTTTPLLFFKPYES